MTNFTLIEYTPSYARYDGCDRAYYSYEESGIAINHYSSHEELMAAARSTNYEELTILVDGIPMSDIFDYPVHEALLPIAKRLKDDIAKG